MFGKLRIFGKARTQPAEVATVVQPQTAAPQAPALDPKIAQREQLKEILAHAQTTLESDQDPQGFIKIRYKTPQALEAQQALQRSLLRIGTAIQSLELPSESVLYLAQDQLKDALGSVAETHLQELCSDLLGQARVDSLASEQRTYIVASTMHRYSRSKGGFYAHEEILREVFHEQERHSLASALEKHVGQLQQGKELRDIETSIQSFCESHHYTENFRELFPQQMGRLNSLAEQITALSKKRNQELQDLTLHTRKGEYCLSKYGYGVVKDGCNEQQVAIAPETLYALKAPIVARYDPQILALCKERSALEAPIIQLAQIAHKVYEQYRDETKRAMIRALPRTEYRLLHQAIRLHDSRKVRK